MTWRVSTEARDDFEWNAKRGLFVKTDAALRTRIETAGKPERLGAVEPPTKLPWGDHRWDAAGPVDDAET